MKGGKSLRFAKVSLALSREEEDQLSRSMKKATTNESQDTMVKENLDTNGKDEGDDEALVEGSEKSDENIEEPDEVVLHGMMGSRKREEDPLCPTIPDLWESVDAVKVLHEPPVNEAEGNGMPLERAKHVAQPPTVTNARKDPKSFGTWVIAHVVITRTHIA
ncbi:hypothetical protein VNO78_27770 [Psophocarpus tetragonolobus]|uniref:Uncharacterized protein n=1 Tax=Psophocarpus tetragonolobus TaxID=3891 RepID=A0AAN9S208_PSOTE